MCDIEYEEFDNKESIYQEFKSMIVDNKDLNDKVFEKIDNEIVSEEVMMNEIKEKPENFQTTRMSDLYSNFSSSWKYKLKSRQELVDCCSMSSDLDCKKINNSQDNESDVSDVEMETSCNESKINEKISQPKKVLVETSTCSINEASSTPINFEEKPSCKTKMVTSSVNCDFKEPMLLKPTNQVELINKQTPMRRVLVESSCDSLSDTALINRRKSINKTPVSRNVAVASFGSSFGDESLPVVPKQETTTTSTETEMTETIQTQSSFTNQANEMYESLEQKILPFIRSANTTELKLKGRLSVFQYACIKQISIQHELMFKKFGKGPDSFILLRKKIKLLNAQKEFLEKKKADLVKQKERTAAIKAKEEKLLNPPKKVSSGCQVDLLSEENGTTKEFMSKNEARRNRKKHWELKQKQKSKKSSGSQTIENGFYVCPYCEDDIPEALQFIHYPHCLEKYRAKTQSHIMSGSSLQTTKSNRPSAYQKKHRSKSRDKMNQSKIDHLKKELEKVHDNDINTIVNIVTEMDKKCAISGCNKKKTKTCAECCADYCSSHFSPDNNNNINQHFNCPILLEKLEIERQKKLGANNPLLKTIEQLKTPQFSDGVLLKQKNRVKLIEKPVVMSIENTSSEINSQNISSPSINQTRTRNGPMLSFERNNLRKDLREKISVLVDKRSK